MFFFNVWNWSLSSLLVPWFPVISWMFGRFELFVLFPFIKRHWVDGEFWPPPNRQRRSIFTQYIQPILWIFPQNRCGMSMNNPHVASFSWTWTEACEKHLKFVEYTMRFGKISETRAVLTWGAMAGWRLVSQHFLGVCQASPRGGGFHYGYHGSWQTAGTHNRIDRISSHFTAIWWVCVQMLGHVPRKFRCQTLFFGAPISSCTCINLSDCWWPFFKQGIRFDLNFSGVRSNLESGPTLW